LISKAIKSKLISANSKWGAVQLPEGCNRLGQVLTGMLVCRKEVYLKSHATSVIVRSKTSQVFFYAFIFLNNKAVIHYCDH
jgi:hypothetical protein